MNEISRYEYEIPDASGSTTLKIVNDGKSVYLEISRSAQSDHTTGIRINDRGVIMMVQAAMNERGD